MNIGLFGLAGVGKSQLAAEFSATNQKFVSIKASEIINSYNKKIKFDELKPCIVVDNQEALIAGFKDYQHLNKAKHIIIELHNLIETPQGVVEINEDIFDALNLSAACFLEASPERLAIQRQQDTSRVRQNLPINKLKILQNLSRKKFLTKYKNSGIPYIVIKSDGLYNLQNFIKNL